MTTATDRFKMLLAGALERVCVLESQLEQRDAKITELEDHIAFLEIDPNTDEQEAT